MRKNLSSLLLISPALVATKDTMPLKVSNYNQSNSSAQVFTFLGGNSPVSSKTLSVNISLPLSIIEVGEIVQIVQLIDDKYLVQQLNHLELVIGRVVKLISRTQSGSVVVDFDHKRVSLGANIARQIGVKRL